MGLQLDSLSKEDLIKFVKKQLTHGKENKEEINRLRQKLVCRCLFPGFLGSSPSKGHQGRREHVEPSSNGNLYRSRANSFDCLARKRWATACSSSSPAPPMTAHGPLPATPERNRKGITLSHRNTPKRRLDSRKLIQTWGLPFPEIFFLFQEESEKEGENVTEQTKKLETENARLCRRVEELETKQSFLLEVAPFSLYFYPNYRRLKNSRTSQRQPKCCSVPGLRNWKTN